MWLFLPMVCILVRIVFGNTESASPFSDVTRSDNGSGEENRIGIDLDAGKSNEGLRRKLKGDLANVKSNRIIVAKRRESTNSWFGVPANEKEFQESSEGKHDHWLRWLEDKRVSSYGQDPDIRRPIRVPFNGWAGKRGGRPSSRSNQIDIKTERNQFTNGLSNRGLSIDGYSVKRKPQTAKVLHHIFDTFPGKRTQNINAGESDEDFDREETPDDSSSPTVHLVDPSTTDEFPEADDKTPYKGESNVIREKDEVPERNDVDVDNRRTEFFMLTPAMRARRTGRFEQWGRKRNSKTYAFHSGDKYFEMPRRPATQVFLPWAG